MAGITNPSYNSDKSKPYYPYFKGSKLYSIILVTLLCTLFYFLGVYQQNSDLTTTTTTNLASRTSKTDSVNHEKKCPTITTSKQSKPSTTQNHKKSISLDFSTQHSADETITTSPIISKPKTYPPCDFKYSEYTPCEDATRSLKFDRDRLIYRERHCPEKGEILKCRIPAPFGYKNPFQWPQSREYAWYANVPHKHLTVEKAVQNWIRFEGDRFRFPGGGTMFPNGADSYIDDIGKLINLNDGSIRTAIDTGCGVASWGAFLLSRDIIAMSFAPRDTHIAQVQFALERGVPALIGVLASIRLPYPSRAFDMAHCSRCLIPWGQNDGQYLIEVDRVLRPGGYWILSGPPINWRKYWKGWERTKEDLNDEQSKIEAVAESLCWKKVAEDGDIAIWQKPLNHVQCKANKETAGSRDFCQAQDFDKAWYTKMEACLTPLPEVSDENEVAGGKIKNWPERLTAVPPRISSGSVEGITVKMFKDDTNLWNKRIAYYKTVNNQLGSKGRYRNLLDMNANIGGFAAAFVDYPLWVMNVVPNEANVNTLGVIYERGLIGTYQNWCESMSTYPRTYDLIHADSIFTLYDNRCPMEDILLEMDRLLRPEGTVIFRDDVDMILKIKSITDGLQWNSQIIDHEDSPHKREKLLFAVKMYWTAPNQDASTSS